MTFILFVINLLYVVLPFPFLRERVRDRVQKLRRNAATARGIAAEPPNERREAAGVKVMERIARRKPP